MIIEIKKEEDMYVSICKNPNIASQGNTWKDALENLIEALELYYAD